MPGQVQSECSPFESQAKLTQRLIQEAPLSLERTHSLPSLVSILGRYLLLAPRRAPKPFLGPLAEAERCALPFHFTPVGMGPDTSAHPSSSQLQRRPPYWDLCSP